MPSTSLTEKYRPKTLQDLVLSPQHGLAASLEFCRSPYASAWLHHGKSGLGKSSLAEIMARVASNPLCIHRYAGPDLTSDIVRSLTAAFTTRPLCGGFYSIVVHEADCIPRLAQVRLLDLLDRLKECHAVVLLTSNDDLPSFEDRFLSRVRTQLFTAQGLAPVAKSWLLRIAANENIRITPVEAGRIIKLSKNNLRKALSDLEVLGAERRVTAPAPSLPDAPMPPDTVPSTGEPVADRRPTAAF